MDSLFTTLIVSAIIIAAMFIVYTVFPRIRGLHYISSLICPKCGRQFDYNWVPGGSFSAVRLGKLRYLRCPHCHKWSCFEIAPTQT